MDINLANKFLHDVGFTPDSRSARWFIITMSELHVSDAEVNQASNIEHLKRIILQKLQNVTIEMARGFVKARLELESGSPMSRTWGIID